VVVVVIVIVIVIVAWGLRRRTERRAFQLADQIRIDRLDARIDRLQHTRLERQLRRDDRLDRLHAHFRSLKLLDLIYRLRGRVGGDGRCKADAGDGGKRDGGGTLQHGVTPRLFVSPSVFWSMRARRRFTISYAIVARRRCDETQKIPPAGANAPYQDTIAIVCAPA